MLSKGTKGELSTNFASDLSGLGYVAVDGVELFAADALPLRYPWPAMLLHRDARGALLLFGRRRIGVAYSVQFASEVKRLSRMWQRSHCYYQSSHGGVSLHTSRRTI